MKQMASPNLISYLLEDYFLADSVDNLVNTPIMQSLSAVLGLVMDLAVHMAHEWETILESATLNSTLRLNATSDQF